MSNKTEYIQVRVTPEVKADIVLLGKAFDMKQCGLVQAMINIVLGRGAPFTLERAQEAIEKASDEPSHADDLIAQDREVVPIESGPRRKRSDLFKAGR